MDLGKEDLNIESSVFQDCSIDSGFGDVEIKDVTSKNLTVHIGKGDLDLKDSQFEDAQCSSGLGDLFANLKNEKDWTVNASVGLGDICIQNQNGNKNFSKSWHQVETSKQLKIHAGLGDIEIQFKES